MIERHDLRRPDRCLLLARPFAASASRWCQRRRRSGVVGAVRILPWCDYWKMFCRSGYGPLTIWSRTWGV